MLAALACGPAGGAEIPEGRHILVVPVLRPDKPQPSPDPERPAAPPGPRLATSGDVPAGFENLDEPQVVVVDVHRGGEPLGRALAEFTPEALRFLDPDEVVRLIPDLLSAEEARAALASPLPVNSHLICRDWAPRPGCGQLDTDGYGIIFDEARLRLDLFVAQAKLAPTGEGRTRYLPAPDGGASVLLSVGGAVSLDDGPDGTATDHSLYLQGAGAIGPVHLLARAVQLQGAGPRLDSAVVGYDHGDWRYRAGLFDETGLAPLRTARLLGVAVGTSFDLRVNRDQTQGTPIQLFLPRRAQVDILRDGRLLASRQVEAGNQRLDTTDLPEGAYPLTLRITDASGQREEQRFFSKSRDLPPSDTPLFRLEAGLRQDTAGPSGDLSADGPFVARGEAGIRLTDTIGVNAGIALEPEALFLGAGLGWVTPGMRAGLRLIASERGDLGGSAFANGTLGRLHWTAAVSGLEASGDADPEPGGAPRSFIQGVADIQYVGRGFAAGVRGTARGGGFGSGWQVGPYSRVPLVRVGDVRVDLNLEALKSDDETRATARVSFHRFGWESRFSQSGDLGLAWSSGGGVGLDAAAGIAWDGGGDTGYDRRVALRAARRLDVSSLGIEGLYRGREGSLRGYADSSFGGGRRTVAGGEFFGNLTLDQAGVAVGGPETQPSAIVVDVQGGDPGARFTVMVDGSPQGTVAAGGPVPFALPPYRTYAVSIVPPSDRLMDISSTAPRRVTLYPGTVVRLSWDVTRVHVMVARIVTVDGRPVEHARVEGTANPAVTGHDGWLQVEVPGAGPLTLSLPGGGTCTVEAPAPDAASQVTVLRDLVCR